MTNRNTHPEGAHKLPIDGTLDLHTFKPSDVGTLIDEFIDACRANGIYEIRIIHGKGTGSLRRSVHQLLERNRYVESFGAGSDKSNWGVTAARLQKKSG